MPVTFTQSVTYELLLLFGRPQLALILPVYAIISDFV